MFCFTRCKLNAARRVLAGEIPISQALSPSDVEPGRYEVSDQPEVPDCADETILVLDFPKNTDLQSCELLVTDCAARLFVVTASVLNTAKVSITPLGIIEYLATQALQSPMLPESVLMWECISNTHPREREEIWGYFLSKACKEFEECTGQYLYLRTEEG